MTWLVKLSNESKKIEAKDRRHINLVSQSIAIKHDAIIRMSDFKDLMERLSTIFIEILSV